MPCRVVMLVSNRYDPDPRVHKEARSLVRAGYQVTVLSWDRLHERPAREWLDGVEIERIRGREARLGDLSATLVGLANFQRAARAACRRIAPRVVHCHDHDTCAVGVWWKRWGAARAGVHGACFVFDAHDLYWTWLLAANPSSAWRRAASRVLMLKDRFYAREADLLLTVTEQRGDHPGLAEIYRCWGAAPCVVMNAPDLPALIPELPARFAVGYFGTVREPEMFEWLGEAVRQLPVAMRPALYVAGGGIAAVRVKQYLQQLATNAGLSVHVTGSFSMADMPALLANVSVQYCVYPTARGNMDRSVPVKLLESVGYGRKVIANRGTLMQPWVDESNWGWCIKEGAIDELVHALQRAHAWHTGGHTSAMAPVPTWAEQAEHLVAAYDRLIA